MSYTISNSESSFVVLHPVFRTKFQPVIEELGQTFKVIGMDNIAPRNVNAKELKVVKTKEFDMNRRALFIYTSGALGGKENPLGLVPSLISIFVRSNRYNLKA